MLLETEQKSITKSVENNCSCKIAINAKGLWSGEIKSYAITLDDAMNTSLKKATELETLIKTKNNN